MQRQKLDLQQDARTGKLLFVENDATGEKTVPISADVDADGSVTATDLALVVDSAGATGVTRADVTADGAVGASDALDVVGSLGQPSYTASAATGIITCPTNDGSIGVEPGPDGCPCEDPSFRDLTVDDNLCENDAGGGGGSTPAPPGPDRAGFNQCVHGSGGCSDGWRSAMKHLQYWFRRRCLWCIAIGSGAGLGVALWFKNPFRAVQAALAAAGACFAEMLAEFENNLLNINNNYSDCVNKCKRDFHIP